MSRMSRLFAILAFVAAMFMSTGVANAAPSNATVAATSIAASAVSTNPAKANDCWRGTVINMTPGVRYIIVAENYGTRVRGYVASREEFEDTQWGDQKTICEE
jgi:hypothetical protein